MSKILITSITTADHYEIMRGESRILSNISFGLKELKHVVYTSHNLSNIEYNFELSWIKFSNISNHRKGICMVTYPYEVMLSENVEYLKLKNGIFVTPYKNLVKYLSDESGTEVKYLPPLFPIPPYHSGFKKYNFNPQKTLKVLVYICSWEKYLVGNTEVETILTYLRGSKLLKDYKFKLYIQIDSESTKRNILNISKLGDEIEYVYKYKYNDYLKFIETMDMFIIKGSSAHSTAGVYDILSLGKPLLYVAWDYTNPKIYRNPLHQHPENIIFLAENSESIISKVEKFLNNTKEFYETFRSCIKDSDFENWKIFSRNIFGE